MKSLYWIVMYLLMGIWLVISPYILNFTATPEAYWNALTVGVLSILISLVCAYSEWDDLVGERLHHRSSTA